MNKIIIIIVLVSVGYASSGMLFDKKKLDYSIIFNRNIEEMRGNNSKSIKPFFDYYKEYMGMNLSENEVIIEMDEFNNNGTVVVFKYITSFSIVDVMLFNNDKIQVESLWKSTIPTVKFIRFDLENKTLYLSLSLSDEIYEIKISNNEMNYDLLMLLEFDLSMLDNNIIVDLVDYRLNDSEITLLYHMYTVGARTPINLNYEIAIVYEPENSSMYKSIVFERISDYLLENE